MCGSQSWQHHLRKNVHALEQSGGKWRVYWHLKVRRSQSAQRETEEKKNELRHWKWESCNFESVICCFLGSEHPTSGPESINVSTQRPKPHDWVWNHARKCSGDSRRGIIQKTEILGEKDARFLFIKLGPFHQTRLLTCSGSCPNWQNCYACCGHSRRGPCITHSHKEVMHMG